MLLRQCSGYFIAISAMFVASGIAMGQVPSKEPGRDFPNRPIRIVTSPTGGGGDFGARIVAPELSAMLGQPIVIDNRPSVIFSGRTLATAPPDGHTLILSASNLWLTPFLRDDPGFNPARDFAPVTWATTAPNIVVAHPSLPANSVKELIALAKAKPGVLNYSSGNTASSSHLSMELFKSMAGIDMVRIGYKGTGPAMIAVMAGEAQVTSTNADATMGHVKAGKLKALAVTSAEASPLYPGVPPMASGLPGYRFDVTFSFLTTAGTPPATIRTLNAAMVRILKQPDVARKFFSGGQEVVGSSPEQLATLMKSDMKVLGKLIKDMGLRE